MSSRIEKLATAYKESKPDIATSGILKRVQLESALAEDRTNGDIRRFSTGLDLVQLQLEAAMGAPLAISQSDVVGKGYAIEARLYAEDANQNFTPVTGTIHNFSSSRNQ